MCINVRSVTFFRNWLKLIYSYWHFIWLGVISLLNLRRQEARGRVKDGPGVRWTWGGNWIEGVDLGCGLRRVGLRVCKSEVLKPKPLHCGAPRLKKCVKLYYIPKKAMWWFSDTADVDNHLMMILKNVLMWIVVQNVVTECPYILHYHLYHL